MLGTGAHSIAPNARNVAFCAWVKPLASQRAEGLATLQVPERDGPVIPATSQPASIRTHLHTISFVLREVQPRAELPAARNHSYPLFFLRLILVNRSKSLLYSTKAKSRH